MKFLESVTGSAMTEESLLLDLDGRHQLRVQAVNQRILRVQLKKDKQSRLPRTWSIALGGGSVPKEGHERDKLRFPGYQTSLNEQSGWTEFGSDQLKVRVHHSPYRLEWFHHADKSWHPLLSERATGSVALGRRDNRIWHFHSLPEDGRFYGLGEKSGDLDRRGRKFEMRNVDPMGYNARTTDPLYKHFPFYVGGSNNIYYGVFYDNLATSTFDFGQEIDNYHGPFTSYRAEDGDLDYYLILGPSLLEVTRSFCWLTGRPYLPPKWSLGYSATSMTYTDVENAQDRLDSFIDQMLKHDIPVKSFKFGSGYTSKEGKRYVFHWNRSKFPDPKAILERFHSHGVRVGANIKPVLLQDHPLYEEAAQQQLFVRDSEQDSQEVSRFWDDLGSHLDFSHPTTIEWWQRQAQEQLLDLGFDALWNDNNEYVVWDDGARCHGFGKELPMALIRPLMSLWMTRASHEQVQKAKPEQRVWSISRCGAPGMQRYSQTWSGDNHTAWETLAFNTKMALGLSMSGVYNIGHDVGGFSGPPPTPEMLTRWFQVGAFHPRFAVNSWKPDGTITEAWMYPKQLSAIKKVMELRMRFHPQLYSLLAESHDKFTPLLRPTFMNFPEDPQCHEFEEDLMWGKNLLIAPVTAARSRKRKVYLPKTIHGWWDYYSGEAHRGGQVVTVDAPLDRIPLMVRGGSFLFLAAPGADSIDGPEEYRELRVFPSQAGMSYSGEFYDDDGVSYDYKTGGFLRVRLRAVQAGQTIRLDASSQGSFKPAYTALRCQAPSGWTVEIKSGADSTVPLEAP